MLQHRQLIHLGSAIIQQAFDQFRIYRGSGFFDRLSNDIIQLVARQRRN
jgi:hypothetical protein